MLKWYSSYLNVRFASAAALFCIKTLCEIHGQNNQIQSKEHRKSAPNYYKSSKCIFLQRNKIEDLQMRTSEDTWVWENRPS